jgi:hypothetical protein
MQRSAKQFSLFLAVTDCPLPSCFVGVFRGVVLCWYPMVPAYFFELGANCGANSRLHKADTERTTRAAHGLTRSCRLRHGA